MPNCNNNVAVTSKLKSKMEIKYSKFSTQKKVIKDKIKRRKFSDVPSATDLLTSSQISKQDIFCSNS